MMNTNAKPSAPDAAKAPTKNGAKKMSDKQPTETAPKVKAPKNRPGDVIHRIALSQIRVDLDWNPRNRSDVFRTVSSEKTTAGFDAATETTGLGALSATAETKDKTEAGLAEAIAADGQRVAGEVRKNPDPKTAEKWPYMLVSGHRRYAALMAIAKSALETGVKNPIAADPAWLAAEPTMRVTISEYATEWEAILAATADNVDRDGMTTPDIAFAIERIRSESQKAKNELPMAEIAKRLGKSLSHCAQLGTIMTKLPARITRHWRDCGAGNFAGEDVVTNSSLPFRVMFSLASVAPENQESEYAKACKGASGKNPNASPEMKKHATACKKAGEIGALLAYFSVTGDDVHHPDWRSAVEALIGFRRVDGNAPTDEQETAIVLAASTAFAERCKELLNEKEEAKKGDATYNGTGAHASS